MAFLRRLSGPVALATLLLVPSAFAMPVLPPIGDLAVAGLQARAGGGSADAAVASLLDRASAEPSRAGEIAAALLLLDRSDDALAVLLSAGRNAEAFDLLVGQWRHDEALALPLEGADTARAIRQASILGRDSEAMTGALGVLSGAPLAKSRALLAALWPARVAEAEAAWTWLVGRGGASSADEALVRVKDILDPARPSNDADILLSGGASLLAGVSPCEQARLGAGLVDLAQARGRSDVALEIAKTWVSVTDSAPASATLGELLANASQWSAAAMAYGHAADLQPEEGGARWLQAEMLRKAGDTEGAATAERRATDAAAQSCSRLRLAHAMDLVGDRAEAARLRESLLREEAPGTPAASAAATMLARRGASTGSGQSAESLRASFADARLRAAHSTLSFAQVASLVRSAQAAELSAMAAQGDVNAALALAEHALAPFLSELDATADVVSALRASDRVAEADALMTRVSERVARASDAQPRSSYLLNARAWFAARTREGLAEGLAAAERATELAPSNVGILDTLAEVRFQLGDRAGALQAAHRALALQPERVYLQRQAERFASGDPATPPPLALD